MTHQDERAVAALIESAHAPTSDTVPAILYHSLMSHVERLDTECAELHCANKRLMEQGDVRVRAPDAARSEAHSTVRLDARGDLRGIGGGNLGLGVFEVKGTK